MNIKHYIITRFSSSTFGYSLEELLNINRLNEKVDMFINTSYKSLKFQTNQNFEHILLLHKDCPKVIIERLECLDVTLTFENNANKYIKSKDVSMYDYLITTRLDDDDMLYKNAVKDIQTFSNIKFRVVGFQNGCTLEYKKNRPFIFSSNYANKGMIALGMSLIQNLNLYPKVEYTIYSGDHTKFKNVIIDKICDSYMLDKNDSYFETEIFWKCIKKDYPLFIYTRHKKSDSYRKAKIKKLHFTTIAFNYNFLKDMFEL